MKLIFFSVLAFSMIGLIIPSGFAEIFIHESDYPFSIQYPTGWTNFEFDDEYGGISIDSDMTGRNGWYVDLWCSEIRGDDCGQAGADYQELNYLKENNKLACTEANYSDNHFRCFEYEVIDEYAHQLDGYRAFTVVYSETWVQDGNDPVFYEAEKGKYNVIGTTTYVLVGNDFWLIVSVSDEDKFDQELTEKILSTFKINDIHNQIDVFTPPTWFESLINAIMSIFNWNTDTSGIIETGIDKVPFEEADDFFNDPNIDWDNPIIIEIDPCEYYEC